MKLYNCFLKDPGDMPDDMTAIRAPDAASAAEMYIDYLDSADRIWAVNGDEIEVNVAGQSFIVRCELTTSYTAREEKNETTER